MTDYTNVKLDTATEVSEFLAGAKGNSDAVMRLLELAYRCDDTAETYNQTRAAAIENKRQIVMMHSKTADSVSSLRNSVFIEYKINDVFLSLGIFSIDGKPQQEQEGKSEREQEDAGAINHTASKLHEQTRQTEQPHALIRTTPKTPALTKKELSVLQRRQRQLAREEVAGTRYDEMELAHEREFARNRPVVDEAASKRRYLQAFLSGGLINNMSTCSDEDARKTVRLSRVEVHNAPNLITFPFIGKDCAHAATFSIAAWERLNEEKMVTQMCPICGISLKRDDIRLDEFTRKLFERKMDDRSCVHAAYLEFY